MRRALPLVLVVCFLAACGGSGVSKDAIKIQFGVTGGLIVPYEITIAPGGAVTVKGNPPATPGNLTSAEDEDLSRVVKDGMRKLNNLQCGGTFPDEAAQFIRIPGKTVIVRGTCDADFTKLWNKLTTALGLNQ